MNRPQRWSMIHFPRKRVCRTHPQINPQNKVGPLDRSLARLVQATAPTLVNKIGSGTISMWCVSLEKFGVRLKEFGLFTPGQPDYAERDLYSRRRRISRCDAIVAKRRARGSLNE